MSRKRINKCTSWDEYWGCAISPMKQCNGCPNADWHYINKNQKNNMENIDGEKKYNEALKRAKTQLDIYSGTLDVENVIKIIFPEIIEDEGERIKKELIKLLRNLFNNYSYFIKDPFYTECISWLEKQGQKTPQWMIDFLDENRGKFASLMGDYDKQRDAEGKLLAIIDWLKKQSGQKLIWSEEDEEILQGIWDEILANKHEAKEYDWKTYDKFLNWLKFLKNRIQPHSKQEWSNEDDVMASAVEMFIQGEKENYTCNGIYREDALNWFKNKIL